MFRMKTANSAVAFVALGHKIFSTRVPVGILAENRNFRADIMRWLQAAFPQNICGHGRSGGLPMHATNNDPAFSLHNCRQNLGTPCRGRFRFAGANENWIVRPDGGGVDDELGWSGIFAAVLLEKFQAQALQPFHFERNRFIRSAHRVAELEQKGRHTAHSAPSHPNEMDAVMLARKKARQTELRRSDFHSAMLVYFSIVSTTALAAFRVDSLAAFCDMRWREPWSLTKERSFWASASSRISDSLTTMAAPALTKTSAVRV